MLFFLRPGTIVQPNGPVFETSRGLTWGLSHLLLVPQKTTQRTSIFRSEYLCPLFATPGQALDSVDRG
jgi:hypothetical protein